MVFLYCESSVNGAGRICPPLLEEGQACRVVVRGGGGRPQVDGLAET